MRRRNADLRRKQEEEIELKQQLLKQVAKETGRSIPTALLLGLPPKEHVESSVVEVGWQMGGGYGGSIIVDERSRGGSSGGAGGGVVGGVYSELELGVGDGTRVSVSEGSGHGGRPRAVKPVKPANEKLKLNDNTANQKPLTLPPIFPAQAQLQLEARDNTAVGGGAGGGFMGGYGQPQASKGGIFLKQKPKYNANGANDDDDDDEWSDDSIGDTAISNKDKNCDHRIDF